ncbi:hypothetical protein [Hymenobacter daeguensis]
MDVVQGLGPPHRTRCIVFEQGNRLIARAGEQYAGGAQAVSVAHRHVGIAGRIGGTGLGLRKRGIDRAAHQLGPGKRLGPRRPQAGREQKHYQQVAMT